MVEEAGDSVTPQVKIALGSIPKECIYASSVLRDECLFKLSILTSLLKP